MDPTRLRADAAGNRARIIEAARAAVTDAGEVKLNAIARQAGVGQGTLYRHFPTREDLLAEVYREDVDALVAAAPALLAEHEPLTALAHWFGRVAGYARVKRGVFAAVEAGVSQALAAHSLGPIGEALTLLLDAGQAEGTIRPDVDARDVILLIGYLTRLDPAEWDTRARHLLQIVLDGLRGPPVDRIVRIMSDTAAIGRLDAAAVLAGYWWYDDGPFAEDEEFRAVLVSRPPCTGSLPVPLRAIDVQVGTHGSIWAHYEVLAGHLGR